MDFTVSTASVNDVEKYHLLSILYRYLFQIRIEYRILSIDTD